jgi:hypothetical protein
MSRRILLSAQKVLAVLTLPDAVAVSVTGALWEWFTNAIKYFCHVLAKWMQHG